MKCRVGRSNKQYYELYDIQQDRDEIYNLAQDPAFAEIEKKMASDLFDWLGKTKYADTTKENR